MHFGRLLLVSAVLPFLALGVPVHDNDDGLVVRAKGKVKPPKTHAAPPSTKTANARPTKGHSTAPTKTTSTRPSKGHSAASSAAKSSKHQPTGTATKGRSSSAPTSTHSASGSKGSACPTKSKPKKTKPSGHSKRAQIAIGYRGTTAALAAEFEQGRIPESTGVARLGRGMYLTDNYEIALSYTYRAGDDAKVCVAYVDDAAWNKVFKVWIPEANNNLVGLGERREEERVNYQENLCRGAGPAVRFTSRNNIPKGNEMVIPRELQDKVTKVECHDPIDEPAKYPTLGLKYNTEAVEWKINGDIPT